MSTKRKTAVEAATSKLIRQVSKRLELNDDQKTILTQELNQYIKTLQKYYLAKCLNDVRAVIDKFSEDQLWE